MTCQMNLRRCLCRNSMSIKKYNDRMPHFFDPKVIRLRGIHYFNNFKRNGNWRQRQRKVCVMCTRFELEKHFKKTHCVASFFLVSYPQVSSSNRFTQAQRHLYRKTFSSPKGYPSIKVGVVGRSGSG